MVSLLPRLELVYSFIHFVSAVLLFGAFTKQNNNFVSDLIYLSKFPNLCSSLGVASSDKQGLYKSSFCPVNGLVKYGFICEPLEAWAIYPILILQKTICLTVLLLNPLIVNRD